jgi:hypothetical protein
MFTRTPEDSLATGVPDAVRPPSAAAVSKHEPDISPVIGEFFRIEEFIRDDHP